MLHFKLLDLRETRDNEDPTCSPTAKSSSRLSANAITVRHVGFSLTNRTGTLDLGVYDDPVSNSATGVSLRLRDLVTSVGVLPELRSREPTLCRFRCTHVDTPPGVVRHRKKHRRGGLQEDPLRKGGGRVEPLVSLTYT